VCKPFYDGLTCQIDLCSAAPSYGAYNPVTNSCVCDEGYAFGSSSSILCTVEICGAGGVYEPCSGSSCAFSGVSYNCVCGEGEFVNSGGSATCVAPKCGSHGTLTTVGGEYSCVCATGWLNNDTDVEEDLAYCTSYACGTVYTAASYWDSVLGNCQCYYPYSNPPNCTVYKTYCGPGSTTPTLIQADPPVYTCTCLAGYVKTTDTLLYIDGEPPCVMDCNAQGTEVAGLTNCECFSGWSGPLCQYAPGTAPAPSPSPPPPPSPSGSSPTATPVPSPSSSASSSSSSSTPVWVWIVVAIVCVAVIAGVVVVSWWCVKHLPDVEQPEGMPEETKSLKPSGRRVALHTHV